MNLQLVSHANRGDAFFTDFLSPLFFPIPVPIEISPFNCVSNRAPIHSPVYRSVWSCIFAILRANISSESQVLFHAAVAFGSSRVKPEVRSVLPNIFSKTKQFCLFLTCFLAPVYAVGRDATKGPPA